jgi:hypothetical protein
MSARSIRLAAPLALAALLAGCASFSADGGFGQVEQVAKDRLGKNLHWARTEEQQSHIDQRVAELLARPLSADDAVQLALLNNRGLQAAFFELGIGEAELVQAGRLPNPGFSFGRLTRGDEVELERGLHFDLAALVAMPMRRAWNRAPRRPRVPRACSPAAGPARPGCRRAPRRPCATRAR